MSNNSFTGKAIDGNNRSVTIIVEDDSAVVTITNNYFSTMQKAISIDSWQAEPTFTLMGNSFVDVACALDVCSENVNNMGYSLAYNYYATTSDATGTLMVIMDSDAVSSDYNENITIGGDTKMILTDAGIAYMEYVMYPYYADAALTTLVYDEDGTSQTVTEAATEALGEIDDLEDLTADDLTDAQIYAITEAAYLVASADAEDLLDDDVIEAINTLDALFVAANGDLTVEPDLNNTYTGTDAITGVEVSGLGLAVYGDGTNIEENTVLTLKVEQTASSDEADLAFIAKPYVNVDNASETPVDNSALNAPVTFLVYLPDSFEGNYATVKHVFEGKDADGTEGTDYEMLTCAVQTNESGDRYIQITVTEFSTFYVTGTTVSSSTSVRNTYYDIDLEDADNGTVTVSSTRAVEGKTITITATPDDGYEIDEVIVLDEGDDEIDVDDEGDGEYTFEMPDEDVTIEVTFVAIDEDEDDDTIAFLDVDADAYYYDAVLWAVEEGITNGVTEYLFAPDTVCTRAQAVTFLWNAAGNPTVFIENPFEDVSEDAWYYDAVLWAVSEGITSGTTETTFAPDSTCTRAQIVTFLWNAAGNSVVDDEMDFTDVAADSWYAEAVRWAVAEEITTGMTATEFAPATNCTRGQIVTFLYRYLGE